MSQGPSQDKARRPNLAGPVSVPSFPVRPLSKSYQPGQNGYEDRVYAYWEQAGCFKARNTNRPGQKAYCIVIPPPNVTGALHMGHALTNTLQDILVRWRRMSQDNVLWLPGTDHAGIATQNQVEKALAKEGRSSRHDLGRAAFIERTWRWKEEHEGIILHQLRKLGSSLDWSRQRFTLDEGLSRAVRLAFVRLYQEGLIYRGPRLIHWCVRCQTALSDLEVIPQMREALIWQLAYPVVGSGGEESTSVSELIVATTRPETWLGDTAVAIHPEDPRVPLLKGKQVRLPRSERLIPIVLDASVDRTFGSGILKVTPGHDFHDAELAARHGLPAISLLGKDGRFLVNSGPYAGMTPAEARPQVLADLKEGGFLRGSQDHEQSVGVCQRCEQVAEPLVSLQWFVATAQLAQPAIDVVQEGKIRFYPETWTRNYFEWMGSIRDWCISRQLWWGHPIPAWHCTCGGISVGLEDPTACTACGASTLRPDPDVLDTWFSSALWPFSTLGWPDQTDDLATFYPTSVLETGFDILFFWVARMIMLGLYCTGEVPFKDVFLHAMVRDETGQKMSKSKGNVLDPLVLIEQHGVDALRLTLATLAGHGRDIKLSSERVQDFRAFGNKLWNAVQYYHHQRSLSGETRDASLAEEGVELAHLQLAPENAWILSRLAHRAVMVHRDLKSYAFHSMAAGLVEFTREELCDWYIESTKRLFKDPSLARQTLKTLRWSLDQLLRLLHPVMPFLTEELWQSLRGDTGDDQLPVTLMLQNFPDGVALMQWFANAEVEKDFGRFRQVVEALRHFRGENRLGPNVLLAVSYRTDPSGWIEYWKPAVVALARLSRFTLDEKNLDPSSPGVLCVGDWLLRVELAGLVDPQEEKARLAKELKQALADIAHVRTKLDQPAFLQQAPSELVEAQRQKAQKLELRISQLRLALAQP